MHPHHTASQKGDRVRLLNGADIAVPMALRDPEFLEKCEQFLLHPAVRALSLAQRVDFLEQKVRP